MKALVIGGAGFIGSHTVDALIKKGFEVRVLDKLQKPVHTKGIPKYINPKAEIVIGDICDYNILESSLNAPIAGTAFRTSSLVIFLYT